MHQLGILPASLVYYKKALLSLTHTLTHSNTHTHYYNYIGGEL